MKSERKITKDTMIADVLEMCPRAPEIFRQFGMGCFACLAAAAETVEQGALMHDLDVDCLVEALNACECVEDRDDVGNSDVSRGRS